MKNKNLHEDSSCQLDQDVLEESTEEILDEGAQNPENGFSVFNFSEELIQTISAKGYSSPTPIQKAAIPELLLAMIGVPCSHLCTSSSNLFPKRNSWIFLTPQGPFL